MVNCMGSIVRDAAPIKSHLETFNHSIQSKPNHSTVHIVNKHSIMSNRFAMFDSDSDCEHQCSGHTNRCSSTPTKLNVAPTAHAPSRAEMRDSAEGTIITQKCNSCAKHGKGDHLRVLCPNNRYPCKYCNEKGHSIVVCPKIKCKKCGEYGHIDNYQGKTLCKGMGIRMPDEIHTIHKGAMKKRRVVRSNNKALQKLEKNLDELCARVDWALALDEGTPWGDLSLNVDGCLFTYVEPIDWYHYGEDM